MLNIGREAPEPVLGQQKGSYLNRFVKRLRILLVVAAVNFIVWGGILIVLNRTSEELSGTILTLWPLIVGMNFVAWLTTSSAAASAKRVELQIFILSCCGFVPLIYFVGFVCGCP